MNTYQAYTYLIKFKPTGIVYYGVRFKNIRLKRTPAEDFMIQYKTSSRQIKNLIKEHGIESFEWEIRKTFDTPEQAIDWEAKVLNRCNVLKKQDIWYNANVSGYKIATPDGRLKISNLHKGIPKSEEHREKISLKLKGKKKNYIQSEECRRKNSEAHKGEKHPMFGVNLSPEERLKRGAKNKGKIAHNKGTPMSQEQKDLIASIKESNKTTCIHCSKGMHNHLHDRWHGDNCKSAK